MRRFHGRAVALAAIVTLACGESPANPRPAIDADSARVAWLRTHVARVRTTDPADRDWTDLEPFRSALGNARIVLLGEATHGDGDSFLARSRLIEFLHEEMDFDVLAFESGLFPVSKAWEMLQAGVPARDALLTAIYPVWIGSREVQPLFEYIEARLATARPLGVAGLDLQMYGSATEDYFVADLEDVLERGRADVLTSIGWPEFRRLLQDGVTDVWWNEKPVPAEKAAFDATYAKVEAALEAGLPGVPMDEASFWVQVLRSTRINLENQIAVDPAIGYNRSLKIARDLQMSENLVWLATTRYPSRKIIVWAHNYHIFRNVGQVEVIGNAGLYGGVTTMGDGVRAAFGDDAYILGFTAHGGEWGYWYPHYEPTPLTKPVSGSLESLMHAAGIDRGFLDLRDAAGDGAWLHGSFVARPLGYYDAVAHWSHVTDGFFVTDTMTRSTPSGWFTIDSIADPDVRPGG